MGKSGLMPAGRPSSYNPQIASKICELIADNYRLRQIETMEGMPSRITIRRWLAKHEEFSNQYTRAREEMVEAMAEEILEISDDARNDWMERQAKNGEVFTVPDAEVVMRSRLRCDSRRWLMSKLLPRKYGDKVAVTGADDGPITIELTQRRENIVGAISSAFTDADFVELPAAPKLPAPGK